MSQISYEILKAFDLCNEFKTFLGFLASTEPSLVAYGSYLSVHPHPPAHPIQFAIDTVSKLAEGSSQTNIVIIQ
jgi:hypothetical protein